jgi:hypothetical protein
MGGATLPLPLTAFMACRVNLNFFTQVLDLEYLVTCNRIFNTFATTCGVMEEIPFNTNQCVNALRKLKYKSQKK